MIVWILLALNHTCLCGSESRLSGADISNCENTGTVSKGVTSVFAWYSRGICYTRFRTSKGYSIHIKQVEAGRHAAVVSKVCLLMGSKDLL